MSNFVPLEDAAKRLGMTADELVEMRSRGAIFGYRDGASWKFKPEEIERVASEFPTKPEEIERLASELPTMMAPDVFIAHSSEDKSIANAVCVAMEQKNIRCWLAPRDLLPGVEWGRSIVKAIENCRVVVLVFSIASRKSRQVSREIARSDHEGKPLILFRVSDIMPSGAMVLFLSSARRIDAVSPPMEPHIDRLIDMVRTVIGSRLMDSSIPLGEKISEPTHKDSTLSEDDDLVLDSELALGEDSSVNLINSSDSGSSQEDEPLDLHTFSRFSAYTGAAPYIFVSYSHKDGSVVFKLIQRLHDNGYKIWYDEGIDPGNEWPDEIAKALATCSHFMVFITPNAVESRNVRNEINFALNKGKPFLAVHLTQTELPPGLELRMGDIQAIMKYRVSEASFFAKLQKVLSSSLRE